MHRFVVAATLCLVATPSFAQMVSISPEQIGEVFCIARLGNDMAPVQGLLTTGLAAAITEADAKNDAIQKAHPDEKPPLGDGIPWQDAPDYAAQCTVGEVTLMQDEAAVAIAYGFPEYPEADFTDHLKLKLVDAPTVGAKVWRIDDLTYADARHLRAVLIDVFDE